jgi:hypothetical protein
VVFAGMFGDDDDDGMMMPDLSDRPDLQKVFSVEFLLAFQLLKKGKRIVVAKADGNGS